MNQETSSGILQGKWGDHASWSFHIESREPIDVHTTSVKGIIFKDKSVCLTKTKRGWEIPGGHIEAGESIAEALRREIFEETGIEHFDSIFFGFIKVINTVGRVSKATGLPYPSKSYIFLYIGDTKDEPEPCTGEDCFDSAFCEMADERVINSADKEILLLAHSIHNSQSR